MNIRIIDKCYTYVTRQSDPNDSWDQDDTGTSHNIVGIEIATVGGYYDISVPFDIEQGKEYFLVYGIYSTGDSFHHEEGSITYVDLFQTHEKAMECVHRLEEHHRVHVGLETYYPNKKREKPPKGYVDYTCVLMDDSEKEYKFHVPWHGYFERLSSLEVIPVSLTSYYKKEY